MHTCSQKDLEAAVTTDPCTRNSPGVRIENHTFTGGAWFGAWLFTIGFLHLSFWQGVFAIVIWPYYVGIHLSALPH